MKTQNVDENSSSWWISITLINIYHCNQKILLWWKAIILLKYIFMVVVVQPNLASLNQLAQFFLAWKIFCVENWACLCQTIHTTKRLSVCTLKISIASINTKNHITSLVQYGKLVNQVHIWFSHWQANCIEIISLASRKD